MWKNFAQSFGLLPEQQPIQHKQPKSPAKENPQEKGVEGDFTPHPSPKRKVLKEWKSLPKVKQNSLSERERKRLIIILVVVGLLFVLIRDFFVIIGILSFAFGYYMLNQWEPTEPMEYKITNLGVVYGEKLYGWGVITHFFFAEKLGNYLLCIDTTTGVPGRLYFEIKQEDEAEVKKILEDYIPYVEEEPETIIEKTYKAIFGRVDLNK